MMPPILDSEQLNHQTFDDPDLRNEILTLFKEQAPSLLAALDAQTGAARSDTAHRLKGSALAIGATLLAQCADALEATPDDGKAMQAVHAACDKTLQAITHLLPE